MSFLSRLFRKEPVRGGVGARADLLTLAEPTVGFLNLTADDTLIDADRARLAPLFARSEVPAGDVPTCDVLFLYATFDPAGDIAGSARRLRQIARAAGARVAVVATENVADHAFNALEPADDWRVNWVLVVSRKGESFGTFFQRLFGRMHDGQSMLVAWVELAPQIPGHVHEDCPESILLPEAGHVTFLRGSRAPGG